MAHNDTPDQEFDPEMERILRDYFAAESPGLRAPGDTWRRLEGRNVAAGAVVPFPFDRRLVAGAQRPPCPGPRRRRDACRRHRAVGSGLAGGRRRQRGLPG